ncbi:hypothetical protein J45TS6_22240 [Paenibacillus sp. J45TS6]|uniref:hypothetical protein n=1 Tax=unclassified Paenibacillus TaxID=185978 RepID=UPI001B003EF5|nr:hypothetical protein [Paenibacillus sp. J45TS6]GIP43765.1 hypothetical protein J45TS6_22240 [Paenibacillus sp. J45TS6]
MSLKNVELQIAIPRTTEAGRYQSEYDHRRSSEQSLLATNENKKTKKESKQSPKTSESEQTGIRDRSASSGTLEIKNSNELEETSEETLAATPAEHPFKGKHIDYSL